MAKDEVRDTGRTPLRVQRSELFLLGVALSVLVLDQLTKQYVVSNLRPGIPWNPIESLRNYISLTYITNTGAAFGMFPAFGTFFAVVAVVVVVAILFYHRQLSSGHWTMQLGLGLQLGGAFGNLTDRLRWGHVIDFIDVKVWPVFNVADSSIVIGVALLALSLLRESEAEPEGEIPPMDPDPVQ